MAFGRGFEVQKNASEGVIPLKKIGGIILATPTVHASFTSVAGWKLKGLSHPSELHLFNFQ
jgi:hypothetical protein